MLFDNFDKKIKEAAEQHHPAYDENAWRKMENLLNEHLPRENNRRRFFLLALTVLVIGGGAFFFISGPHAKNSEPTVQQNASSTADRKGSGKTDNAGAVLHPEINDPSADLPLGEPEHKEATKIADKGSNGLGITGQKLVSSRQLKPQPSNNDVSINNFDGESEPGITVNQLVKKSDENQKAPVISKANNTSNKDDVGANGITKPTEVKANPQEAQETSTRARRTPKKSRSGAFNGLSFFVSAGPDVSKAQNSKAGKVTMSWGLGVAYTLNRFTIKAGVFAANKKYWAGPDDYKLSYTPPTGLKFMGADANCKVIDIPVKLSYDFAVNDRSSWFAGAGLSSYLMKREDYLYEYKTNTGNSYYHPYETKNENRHYFSVLNLSGGYSYRLSNTISLSAEPYVEVPLTGIGAGKVHLNSGGILFTVGVSPFKK